MKSSKLAKLQRYLEVLRRTRFGYDLPFRGLANYIKNRLYPYGEYINPAQMGPLIAQLFITNKCNLSCPFCVVSMPKRQSEAPVFMTPDYVDSILSTSVMNGLLAVILTGGEPLINKHVSEIIRIIKSHNLQCGMITNGLLLPSNLHNLLDAGLDEVQVSVYDHTLDKLSVLLPTVNGRLKLNASYVLLRSALEVDPQRIVNVVKACRQMGFSSFRFSLCQPFDSDTTETIYDDNQYYNNLTEKLRQECDGFPLFIPHAIRRTIRGRSDKKCYIPWQQIFIYHDGKVSMCCDYRIYTSQRGTLFDLNDCSYNSKDLRDLRKSLIKDDPIVLEQCSYCQHLAGSLSSNL